MEQSQIYGQMDFNLPHDVISLPSKGVFYKPRKESLKVGYLTALDENMLMSPNVFKDGLVYNLLKSKIYEPGFDVNQLLSVDVQAILIFLRNTSFGSDYGLKLVDPRTNSEFEITYQLEEIDYIEPINKPNDDGTFSYTLPSSNKVVRFKLLTLGDQRELEKLTDQYPKNMIVPKVTKKLEKQIVEIDGMHDRGEIAKIINNLPIKDSKQLQKFILDCEPSINLKKSVFAPSGEKVDFELAFGVEFFRPFFSV